MSAFGIDTPPAMTTLPTYEYLGAFFTTKDGVTVPTDDAAKVVMAQLAARSFVPMATEGKSTYGYAAPLGSANGPTALQVITEAVSRDPKVAVFVDKTIVVPDTLAKWVVITSDSEQIRKSAAEPAGFWLTGAKPGAASTIFGLPIWAVALGGVVAVGIAAMALSRKSPRRVYSYVESDVPRLSGRSRPQLGTGDSGLLLTPNRARRRSRARHA